MSETWRLYCYSLILLTLGDATWVDDFDGMAAEVVSTAQTLVRDHPKVKAIVLECTNMPPFTSLVEEATGRKVWDILTLGRWLYSGAVGTDWKTVQADNP